MFNVKSILLHSVFILFLAAHSVGAESVFLKGANGRVVEFAGVRSAGPQGLMLLMQADGDEMLVGWDKVDLEDLKKHDKIYSAYQNAQNGRETTLNLGVYEGAISQDQFLKSFKKALQGEDTYKVPRMSEFFEHKNDDQYFLSTSKSEDANAAKRSKRFVSEYEKLIEEFFQLTNVSYYKNTITWHWSGSDPYIIVKECYPNGKSSVKLSKLDLLSYYANEQNGSKNKATKYLNSHFQEVEPMIRVLKEYKSLAQTKLMADEAQKSRYIFLLDEMLEHFEEMRGSITLNRSMVRDCEGFIREFKLGRS